jgi:mono/diheme cytochrome c family protein
MMDAVRKPPSLPSDAGSMYHEKKRISLRMLEVPLPFHRSMRRRPTGFAAAGLAAVMVAGIGAFDSTDAADFFKGRKIYDRECASCHGTEGAPVMPGTPNFVRGEGLRLTDSEMRRVILDGKTLMPGYERRLSRADIQDVTAYIRTLQRY